MSFILSEKTDNALIIHPIYETLLINNPKKYLTMPNKFDIREMSKDNDMTFTKEKKPLRTDYYDIFMSVDTFFISCFDAKTFDERLKLLNDAIDEERHNETIMYIMVELLKGINSEAKESGKEINNTDIDKMVIIYNKYTKKYFNEDTDYKTSFEYIKSLIKKN